MGTALRLAVGVLVVAVVLVGLLWAVQRRLVFLPGGSPSVGPEQVLAGGTRLAVPTDDGLVLEAWHAPAAAPARGITVLVLPGNAGSRADRVPLARVLTAEGLDVVLLDYRGYGGNPGSPSEEGLASDALAAHRHLTVDRGLDARRLVVFGESVGAAVATRLARERPVRAVVLRSPFTELADVAARLYPFLPVRVLLRDRFPVLGTVSSVPAPVTVVAGGADEIVPVEQSRAVAAAARSTPVEVPGARHNDPELGHGPAVVDAVVRAAG
ncbi:alpha/beta hydrolase [Pseudonocardia yuanmonensis]|uniref:Alpha/beta hydrolase n=1 Tax=Pseudonocardia yuanmonensis TaxID=1095914 RepID=A0ABP8WVZ5_9PSEU